MNPIGHLASFYACAVFKCVIFLALLTTLTAKLSNFYSLIFILSSEPRHEIFYDLVCKMHMRKCVFRVNAH